MQSYVYKNQKKLRCGYTTGSCAAAAAGAATAMLLSSEMLHRFSIDTPSGKTLVINVKEQSITDDMARCSVIKDSGDDPDVTNGIAVFATVQKITQDVVITAGKGVGVVTQKGLSVEVGQPAINPVPMQMIESEIKKTMKLSGYNGGIKCEITIPDGEQIAKKTLNEKLGIVGGISIIGTTGIVEPMSDEALKQSLALEVNVIKEKGYDSILITPGNYGISFCKNTLKLDVENFVKYGNYTGFILDEIASKDFKKVLLVGHLGKLIKNAGGIMQTHSSVADGRMEILGFFAALYGASQDEVKNIYSCVTTDAAVDLIKDKYSKIFDIIADAVVKKATEQTKNHMEIGTIVYSSAYGLLGKSKEVKEMLSIFGGILDE